MGEHAIRNADSWMSNIRKMTDALNEASARDGDSDDIIESIYGSPLSVRVRGGWYAPGAEDKGGEPEEFEILLTTGGPALRIVGDLDRGQPEKPRLQWQDWGTPWTDAGNISEQDEAALLTFARQFYFGD